MAPQHKYTEKWVITNVTDSFYTVAYPKATTVSNQCVVACLL